MNGVIKGIQIIAENGESANYYVITNTRGDVTQIYDEAGSLQVVYAYDSWGRILSVKDGSGNEITDDNNVGRLNSLRYRGYYYDEETGVYYLQSRYYDPVVGRFVNADKNIGNIGKVLNHNIFLYCQNNPINNSDPDGYEFVSAIISGGVGALLGYAVAKYYKLKGWKYWACIAGSAVGGAAIEWFAPQVVLSIARSRFIKFGTAVLSGGPTIRDRLLNTIQNQKLWNCVNELYRAGAKIGDGGTAAALRKELAQGLGTKAPHWLKAIERIKNLQNIINKQNLNKNDLAIAKKLIEDLQKAMSGK